MAIRTFSDAPVQTYTVQRGDSLSSIAQKLGYCVTNRTVAGASECLGVAKVIAQANGLIDITNIITGQILKIPQDAGQAQSATFDETTSGLQAQQFAPAQGVQIVDVQRTDPVGPPKPSYITDPAMNRYVRIGGLFVGAIGLYYMIALKITKAGQ